MLHTLLKWDKELFVAINSFHSEFSDHFFWIFTQKTTWIPLYVILLILFYKNYKKDFVWIVLTLVVGIALSDQISSSIIKPLVERLRPSQEHSLNGIIHLINGYKGGKYGFVSSHAANSFALAIIASRIIKSKPFTWIIFIWAVINTYSRIYIGVHYPLDCICGILVGAFAAVSVCMIIRKYKPQIFENNQISAANVKWVYLVLGIEFFLIISYSLGQTFHVI
jgi:undecaprenyl-diphosphatase